MAKNGFKYDYSSVPSDVAEALEEIIEDNQLDCVDNYRFSPMDDAKGMGEFEDIRARGCCGSFEFEYKAGDGRVWAVGCNYGH